MKKLSFPDSGVGKPSQFAAECWFDDACILDMDYFVKTLAGIKAKGVSPDLIGSIITHYASKWLPDLAAGGGGGEFSGKIIAGGGGDSSPESATAAWMKKRFFVETLVGVLPPERDSVPCDFLLRLLRTAAMVGAEAPYRAELERRVAWRLEQASLGELMIPSFSHTCGTLLDVEMVRRLVERFVVGIDEAAGRGGAALVKVARLVDCYLAEAAVDANLTVPQFVALAGALPGHARSMDDGLYRAVDTYLKAHPGVSKQDRKTLCRLIDSQKLSPEASFHAAQNERLPIRAVIQVLFSEQTKLNRHIDWSGSFSSQRSPNPIGPGLDHPSAARCHSKREVIAAQQNEIRKLRDDVIRLQSQVTTLQLQMERLLMGEKKSKKGFFRWNKLGLNLKSSVSVVEEGEIDASGEVGFGRLTPIDGKPKLIKGRTPPKLRKSMS